MGNNFIFNTPKDFNRLFIALRSGDYNLAQEYFDDGQRFDDNLGGYSSTLSEEAWGFYLKMVRADKLKKYNEKG